MEEEMKDFERLLNIRPEESFELDARNYAFNTFKIIWHKYFSSRKS